ncbi:MAG TPA: hypothetical protein PKC69_13540, partial [Chitinophagaceae bacterium]|nr:hypothetical protein [Chitinophagaceae bacterium]
IFLIRKKGIVSPFRVWGHPVLPALFILFCIFYLGTTLWHDIASYAAGKQPVVHSLLGLLITTAGIPLYIFYHRRWRKDANSNT